MSPPLQDAQMVDVSIVICTRNRAVRLNQVLKALKAIVTDHSYEVLWVDNASTDHTAVVLKAALAGEGYSRYFYQPRIGLGAARDFGWRQARGRIIAFTDDDCYPEVDYVDALVMAFAENPRAGCIGGRILLHNPGHAAVTIDEGTEPRVFSGPAFLPAGALQGANMAFRREALEAAQGVDNDLGAGTPFPCEDIDAAATVLWAGFEVRFDPRPVVRHDHGRVEADIPALVDAYDRGRGGYYAKFILRPDTRKAYVSGWLGLARQRYDRAGLMSLLAEMRSAARYARFKHRLDALLLAAPIALSVLAALSTRLVLRIARRRLAT